MLKIAERTFALPLFLGTGKFSSYQTMQDSIVASGTELVTVALKRLDIKTKTDNILTDDFISHLRINGISLLPNTSGARTADEAILAAELAREALETNWIKLEIHPDQRYLMPDPLETFSAAAELVKRGFVVLPYIHADPVLSKRLEDVGVQAVMPLAAPIGSKLGLTMREMLRIIIAESRVPVIVDAGIGTPSDAAAALELGADGVLINTAIADAGDPVEAAKAFKLAVQAGMLFKNNMVSPTTATATSPLNLFANL